MGNIITKKLMSHMMAYFAFVHLKMKFWAIPWPGIDTWDPICIALITH